MKAFRLETPNFRHFVLRASVLAIVAMGGLTGCAPGFQGRDILLKHQSSQEVDDIDDGDGLDFGDGTDGDLAGGGDGTDGSGDTDNGAGTDTGTDAGTDTGSGTGTDTNTGTDTDTGTGTGTGTDTGTNVGGGDSGTGTGTGTGTGPGTGTDTGGQVVPPVAVVTARCPVGFMMSGLSAEGRPVCKRLALDGIMPAWNGNWHANQFFCPDTHVAHVVHSEFGNSNNANWVVCYLRDDQVEASGLTVNAAAFSCPKGSGFRGFDSSGNAVCRSFAATIPNGQGVAPWWNGNWFGNGFSCPFGTTLIGQHAEANNSNNAVFYSCQKNETANFDFGVAAEVARTDELKDSLCPTGQYAVGIDSLNNVLCEVAPSSLVPPGFGYMAHWDGNWRGNGFSCPSYGQVIMTHYEASSSNNANIFACY